MPFDVRRTAAGLQVRVQWLRLFLLLVGLGVAGWIGAAASVYGWVKYRRGFTSASFADILLPNRWKAYATARGNFYIEQAKTELRTGKWADAIYHLRVGVGAAPSNIEGRLNLVQVFVLFERIELARRVLLEGLPYGRDDMNYLRALFSFLLRYQEDSEAVRLALELLPPSPVRSERNQLVALGAAEAYFFRGNFPAAEKLIAEYDLLRLKDGQLVQAQIDWDSGRRDAAVERLKARVRESNGDDDYYNQLALYCRQLGRSEDVERFAVLRELGNPKNPAARLEILRILLRKKETSVFERELARYLADFGGTPNGVLDLGNLAIEFADPRLAQRVYELCNQKGFDAGVAAIMVAESLLAAGEPRAAIAFVQGLNRDNPEWFRRYQGLIASMEAVACYALGQRTDGELYLNGFLSQAVIRADYSAPNFLGRPGGRTTFLMAVASRLAAAGAREEALRVLSLAVTNDSHHQPALTAIVELELQLGRSNELAVHLQRLLAMRRPSLALLRTARATLGGDRYLFSPERDTLLEGIEAALAADPAANLPAPAASAATN